MEMAAGRSAPLISNSLELYLVTTLRINFPHQYSIMVDEVGENFSQDV